MITRYSRPEMRAIWTDENKLKLWLQIELLASEALVEEGIVPTEDFAKIRAGCDKWFADLPGLVARQRELEKTLNHDVIGFTTAVAEKINDKASRWFHFGLTSSDVGDTCYAVQMMQSADLLIADVKTARASIAKRASEHKFTPCIGRSHGIQAEPTTFGLKLALMYDEFGRALERLERVREVVAVGKISGAVGTSAHLSPHVEAYVCENLASAPPPSPRRSYSATFTPNSRPRSPSSARASSGGLSSSATCSAPKFSKPKSPSPKARKAAAPCRTSATPLRGNASPASPACCAATPSPRWKTSRSGTSATSATAASSASSSPTPARCSTTCSACSRA